MEPLKKKIKEERAGNKRRKGDIVLSFLKASVN